MREPFSLSSWFRVFFPPLYNLNKEEDNLAWFAKIMGGGWWGYMYSNGTGNVSMYTSYSQLPFKLIWMCSLSLSLSSLSLNLHAFPTRPSSSFPCLTLTVCDVEPNALVMMNAACIRKKKKLLRCLHCWWCPELNITSLPFFFFWEKKREADKAPSFSLACLVKGGSEEVKKWGSDNSSLWNLGIG